MAHTPTPWMASGSKVMTSAIGIAHCRVAAVMSHTQSDENAAFIVRACNAHDALLAALNEMLFLYAPQATVDQTVEGAVDGTRGGAAVAQARAAVSKAEAA